MRLCVAMKNQSGCCTGFLVDPHRTTGKVHVDTHDALEHVGHLERDPRAVSRNFLDSVDNGVERVISAFGPMVNNTFGIRVRLAKIIHGLQSLLPAPVTTFGTARPLEPLVQGRYQKGIPEVGTLVLA